MYKQRFGKLGQLQFQNEEAYYELLGYLAKSDNSTRLKWEDNDVKGTAWGKELRIEFFVAQPVNLTANLPHSAGNGHKILTRVNCNEFVRNIVDNNNFVMGFNQNAINIRSTIPAQYQADFDRGLAL